MNVTLPNGKVIKGVPKGTSKDEIAQKAISSGLATYEDFGMQEPQKYDLESMTEIGGAPELNELSMPAFKASLGLLTSGDTESLKGILKEQYGDRVSFENVGDTAVVKFPSGEYVLNKPGLSGQDAIRFLSQALAFTPAGRAPTIAKAALGAGATETAIAATEQSLGGQDVDAGRVLTSAALGAGFKGIEDLVGAAWRGYKGVGTSQASELVEQASDAGIPLMTSDVVQPKTFAGKIAQQTAEKIPVAGTGAAREAQQEMRQAAIEDVANKYSEFSYSSIVDSLKSQKDKVKRAAGSTLQSAGEKLDSVGELSAEKTKQAIMEVSQELSKPGVIKSGSALEDLKVLSEAIESAPQTFTSLKENRTAFRDIVESTDKADRSQLTSNAKRLLTKVQAAMTQEMDDFAKANLSPTEYRQWKNANSVYADEAKKLSGTKLKNILDKGDITPESVQMMLFSKKPSEVKQLYSSLTNEGRQNARAAIISKVVNDLSRRANGFTPNSFVSELKKYDDQISVFFKGAEKKQLEGLRRALEATKRAQDAAVTTPTGQQLLGAGTLAAAATDLGLTTLLGGTVGGIARTYESAPVRNALLRLASVPKGSTEFEKALLELNSLLSASAQAASD